MLLAVKLIKKILKICRKKLSLIRLEMLKRKLKMKVEKVTLKNLHRKKEGVLVSVLLMMVKVT